jgi:hypothetical protein
VKCSSSLRFLVPFNTTGAKVRLDHISVMSFESNSAQGEPKIEDEGDSAGQIVSMGYGGTQMQSGKEAAVEQAGIEVGATYSEDNVGTAPLTREVVTSKDSKGAEQIHARTLQVAGRSRHI